MEPRSNALTVEILLESIDLDTLGRPDFLTEYRTTLNRLITRYRPSISLPLDTRPRLHQLGLSPSLVSFLRYALGWSRALPSEVERVRKDLRSVMEELAVTQTSK